MKLKIQHGVWFVLSFLALQSGLVNLREMGLAELDWVQGFGQGLAAAGAFLLILLVAGWQWRHVNAAAPPGVRHILLPLETAATQLLWALLWVGGARLLTAQGLDADMARVGGAWLGLALIVTIWLADPARRASMRLPAGAPREMTRLALALATTVVFILSGNLWLCWALHTAALLIL
ncbi:MAG: hypothetical protein WBV59_06325 [Anaerolineae bacterium]